MDDLTRDGLEQVIEETIASGGVNDCDEAAEKARQDIVDEVMRCADSMQDAPQEEFDSAIDDVINRGLNKHFSDDGARREFHKVVEEICKGGRIQDCDTDEPAVKLWCSMHGDCLSCCIDAIKLLRLERGAGEAYVVARRREHGEGLDDPKPCVCEHIFRERDSAREWVRSQTLTIEPHLCMDTDDRELWTYYHNGMPIATNDLPQYVIHKYAVE